MWWCIVWLLAIWVSGSRGLRAQETCQTSPREISTGQKMFDFLLLATFCYFDSFSDDIHVIFKAIFHSSMSERRKILIWYLFSSKKSLNCPKKLRIEHKKILKRTLNSSFLSPFFQYFKISWKLFNIFKPIFHSFLSKIRKNRWPKILIWCWADTRLPTDWEMIDDKLDVLISHEKKIVEN